METIPFWWWISIGGFLAVLEILLPTYFFLWLSLAGFIMGVITWLAPGIYIWQGIIIFSFLSVIIMYAAGIFRRQLIRKDSSVKKNILNNRLATYYGRVTPITSQVIDSYGEIVLDDMTWKVKANQISIPVGTKVKIIGDEGMVLLVEQIKKSL